jgi:hypothetical protein
MHLALTNLFRAQWADAIHEKNSDTLRAEFETHYPEVVDDLQEKEDSEDYSPLFNTGREDQED